MKWMQMYLVGYFIFVGGLFAALWKMGVIERAGTTWTVIGVVIAVGLGVMFSVANSGKKETVEVEKN